MDRRNPRVIGFLAGFLAVMAVGLAVLAGWSLFAQPDSPTPVPSAPPVADRESLAAAGGVTSTLAQDLSSTSDTLLTTPPPASTATRPRSGSVEHTVRPGDTLFDIALAYAVSVEAIQAANNLQGETIVPGQVLVIPLGPPVTATPYVEGGVIVHTVSSGETLIGIAAHYSVTVEAIQAANDLTSETILPGWQLRIPAESAELAATPPVTAAGGSGWQPSILTGNLAEAYPLTLERPRFTMHYQPDTPAARAPGQVAALIESALDHIEQKLRVDLEQPFDVYIAGSLFAPDDTALRGRSFSSERRNFYLYDDTGTPNERRYVITHELTHMVAWNTLGRPSSVMLHEGLAVYAGIEAMQAAGFLPLEEFCAALQQADQLPRLSEERAFLGHIRDLDFYFAAGCFVQHLIERYGISDFETLLVSGDYPGLYGRTLAQLEAEWADSLPRPREELPFAPAELVTSMAEVADAYDRLFEDFQGTPAQMAAYRQLDQARMAMLQGRFDEVPPLLEEYEQLLKEQ